ncbi:hypothetical protein IPG41_00990 [Candidatus Peregrinibacteria bacterium]|nr:MAG: hypothetical protein IPG41_00990 [Candidatus Peregrinibacteria bacterium]
MDPLVILHRHLLREKQVGKKVEVEGTSPNLLQKIAHFGPLGLIPFFREQIAQIPNLPHLGQGRLALIDSQVTPLAFDPQRLAQAETNFRAALDCCKEPISAVRGQILMHLGDIAYLRNQHPIALAYYEAAHSQGLKDPELYFRTAQTAFAMQRMPPDSIQTLFKTAINGGSVAALYPYAQFFKARHDGIPRLTVQLWMRAASYGDERAQIELQKAAPRWRRCIEQATEEEAAADRKQVQVYWDRFFAKTHDRFEA